MRARFEAAVETSDLVVRLGRWKESPESPRPVWETLANAKVWTDPKFAALRDLLAFPRDTPTLTVNEDADVRGLQVPPDAAEGRAGCKVDAYKATTGSVPAQFKNLPVRMAFVHVVGDTHPGLRLHIRVEGLHPLAVVSVSAVVGHVVWLPLSFGPVPDVGSSKRGSFW
jgi:hypothetical protein